MIIKKIAIPKANSSLILILALFLISRLVLLFGSTNLFFEKELYIGTVANDFLKGTAIPIMDYQVPRENGGKLFMGLFTVPFFTIFGIKGTSIKLAALCFALITLICYYSFIHKYFGETVANLFGIFFTFPSPIFGRFNLINTGTYLEPAIFVPLAFFFLYKILYENSQNPPVKPIHYLAMGFFIGFGIWFLYIYLITLFVCIILLYLHRDKITAKNITCFCIGLLLGLLPWFYYNCMHRFLGLFIKTRQGFIPIIGLFKFENLFLSLKNLLVFYLPQFYFYSENSTAISKIISYTHYFIFIISLLYLSFSHTLEIEKPKDKDKKLGKENIAERLRNYKILPLLLFVIFFLAALLLDDVSKSINPKKGFVGFRYLIPLYPFQILFISLFIKRLRFLAVKIILTGFIVLAGIFGIAQDVSFENIANRNFRFYRAYSYEILGFNLAEASWSFDVKSTLDLLEKVKPNFRHLAYQGLGWEAASKLDSGEIQNLDIINLINPSYKRDFFIGLGRYSSHEIPYEAEEQKRNEGNEELKYFLKNIPQEYLSDFYFGLGQKTFLRFNENIVEWMKYPQMMKIDKQYLSFYYKGVGYAIGKNFGFNKAICTELVNKAPSEYEYDCLRGLFSAFADNRINDR